MNYLEQELKRQQEIVNNLKRLIDRTKRENDILELNNRKKELEIYKIINNIE